MGYFGVRASERKPKLLSCVATPTKRRSPMAIVAASAGALRKSLDSSRSWSTPSICSTARSRSTSSDDTFLLATGQEAPLRQTAFLTTSDAQPENGDDRLPEFLYPQPNIDWKAMATGHPSIWSDNSTRLAQPFDFLEKLQAPVDACPVVASELVVKLLGVEPFSQIESSADTKIRASAFYDSEELEVIDARKLHIEMALGSSDENKDDFGYRFLIPRNVLEQFVKVAIYQADTESERLIAEASIPVADPAAEKTSLWPLLTPDFEQFGQCQVQLCVEVLAPESLPSTEMGETLDSLNSTALFPEAHSAVEREATESTIFVPEPKSAHRDAHIAVERETTETTTFVPEPRSAHENACITLERETTETTSFVPEPKSAHQDACLATPFDTLSSSFDTNFVPEPSLDSTDSRSFPHENSICFFQSEQGAQSTNSALVSDLKRELQNSREFCQELCNTICDVQRLVVRIDADIDKAIRARMWKQEVGEFDALITNVHSHLKSAIDKLAEPVKASLPCCLDDPHLLKSIDAIGRGLSSYGERGAGTVETCLHSPHFERDPVVPSERPGSSIQDWLDTVVDGIGVDFVSSFRKAGLEFANELADMPSSKLVNILSDLQFSGAKPSQLRLIRNGILQMEGQATSAGVQEMAALGQGGHNDISHGPTSGEFRCTM